ncbi:MAG: CaiB/BaiF CoA-transferase family protein [bacterium]|nr:CaiB/BaiF CoA-transferase family protein [bacterium]
MAGPLSGFRIIELAGIGPGPYCGMMLADQGAEVIRIDRPGVNPMIAEVSGHGILFRNRRTLAVDLKKSEGVETVLRLCEGADALFEGFRPGVTERLGLGPEVALARNPKLVYGRMTGWGQEGPMARQAGHDINYIALTGALHAMGRTADVPSPPLNLVGDFGGGGMMMAYGIVCALLEAQKSGKGQVVDAAMVDGAASLMAMFYGLKNVGMFNGERGTHMLDTGAHFYDVYETADGKFLSVGAIEPQFYAILKEKAQLPEADFGVQMNTAQWPEQKLKIAAIIKQKTRAQWTEIFDGTDACVAPVLDLEEAPQHPHMKARKTFIDVGGSTQPAPVPRFSRTPAAAPSPMVPMGQDSEAVLRDFGFSAADIEKLFAAGAVANK